MQQDRLWVIPRFAHGGSKIGHGVLAAVNAETPRGMAELMDFELLER